MLYSIEAVTKSKIMRIKTKVYVDSRLLNNIKRFNVKDGLVWLKVGKSGGIQLR